MGKIRPGAIEVAAVIVSALLAIGVMTVFSGCAQKEDGTWMHCHDAQLAVAGCAAAIAAALVVAAVLRQPKARAALYALCAAGSCAVFAIPGGIVPMCMMQTMRCYEVMQPFVRIMTVATAALCVLCLVRSLREGGVGKAGR